MTTCNLCGSSMDDTEVPGIFGVDGIYTPAAVVNQMCQPCVKKLDDALAYGDQMDERRRCAESVRASLARGELQDMRQSAQ